MSGRTFNMGSVVVRSTFQKELAALRGAEETISSLVQAVHPGSMSGDDARAAVELLAQVARSAESGIALLTPRVVETGVFTKGGHASAPDWLGAATGTSAGVAKGRLVAAQGATKVPGLDAALHDGALSSPELSLLAGAEAAVPGAAGTLLGLLRGGNSHQELSDEAARIKAAARSAEAEYQRRERVHARRHFRVGRSPDGGIRGDFSCDEVSWARVFPGLEAATRRRFKSAGAKSGVTMDMMRLDAFIELMERRGAATSVGTDEAGARGVAVGEPAWRPEVVCIVDHAALMRGTTETGEICEIKGVGPVPVHVAQELLGHGAMQIVIKEGVDIRTVTNSSRRLAQKTLIALVVRDPNCVVPGCGKHLGLENDHCFVDFIAEGPTTLANLARLCAKHHDMKTYGGWRLEGGPGCWRWIAPKDPPTARRIAAARRLAAIKAKAGITSKSRASPKSPRNQPLQT
jgi:hypothetical protein